ncbi:MAG: DMT family transporter [Planctomycetota bacterium]
MSDPRPVWFYHAMALFTVLVWSWSYVHVIWLTEAVGPSALVALRMDSFGIALLVLWIWRRPKLRHITRRQWVYLIIVGFVSYPGYHFPLAWGADNGRTDAALIGLIIATIPVHAGWLAWLVLRERINGLAIIALSLGLVGVATVVIGRNGTGGLRPDTIAGPLAITFSSIMGAGIATLNRGARHILKPMDLVAVGGVIGFLMSTVLHFPADAAEFRGLSLANYWQIFFLGFIAIGICYVTWITALSGLRTVNVAIYLFLAAILSALWGFLFQGNEIGLEFFIGAVFVLAGLLTMVATTPRRAPSPTPTPIATPTAAPADDPA